MKKILFFILLSMSVTCFGQGTQSIDSIQITEADSIHAGSHTFSDTKLEDVTKAEGDSAYIKDDYATAIQIYESLLKNGESADVYYNLGNSYYKAGEIAKAVLNYERACSGSFLCIMDQSLDKQYECRRMGYMGNCLLYSIYHRFLLLYFLQADYTKKNRIYIRYRFLNRCDML